MAAWVWKEAGRRSRSVPGIIGGLVVVWLLAAGAVTAAEPATQPARALSVVMDDNYPPYVFRDASGSLRGILVDRWQLWTKRTGRAAELHAMDWGEAQRRFVAGEFDVIDTIFGNESRQRIFEFSEPYARIDVPLFFHKDISGIQDAADAKGFVVAAKAGDAVIEVLKSQGVTTILEFNSYEAIISAAAAGKVKVFTVDRPPALYYLNRMGIAEQFHETKPLYVGEFHRAARKGNRALLNTVERGFTMISDQENAEIDRRWLGSPILGEVPWRIIGFAGGGTGAVVLVLFLWVWSLRRSVALRTAELRLSEERLRLAMDATSDGLWDWNVKTDVGYFSPGYYRMLGYEPGGFPMSGDAWTERIHPDDRERTLAANRNCIENRTADFEVEFRMKTKDGQWKWIMGRGSAVARDAAGRATRMVGTHVDISERKRAEEERIRLEEQLRQSQKMEAVGGLAGGIAHDLNNLLTPILGYAEMLEMGLPQGDDRREDVLQIQRAAERARDLNRQLLAFGRKQMLELKPIDLRLVLTSAERMLRRTIREDVRIELALPSSLGIVRADVGQIEMVLMNLAVNAQDAMPRGGVLTLGLQNATVDVAGAAGTPGMTPGRYIVLTASDTGIGMNKETQARIFEPFFTTKAPGRGTGLGLSTVYGIIKQHGGYVKVESDIRRGTTFRIYIPRVTETPEAAAPSSPSAGPNRGAGETILLVEDNEVVRNMTCRLLRDWGYTVLAAGTVEQADDIIDATVGPIHLLLTDVIMPTMNGHELYEHLRTRRPGLKVIFMSGYASDVIAPHGVMDEGVQFIQKPFSSAALFQKVRLVLEGT